jgi:hypothetical protein
MIAVGAWSAVDSLLGRALLAAGVIVLGGSLLRRRHGD